MAFIDWDGLFVSAPMWDLGHAVWQFGPVCDDGDPWLRDWPAPPNRAQRIAALVRSATGWIRAKPGIWVTWWSRSSPVAAAA